jgi:hypothetical protein
MNSDALPSRLGSVPGLCDIATFYRRLILEITWAERTERPLGVAVFQVPPLTPEKQRELELALCQSVRTPTRWAGLPLPWHLLSRFVERRRKADVPGRLTEQLLAVILCDTNQGEIVAERIQRRLAQAGECPIASGFAAYPSGAHTASDLINMATWRSQAATPFDPTSSTRGWLKTPR